MLYTVRPRRTSTPQRLEGPEPVSDTRDNAHALNVVVRTQQSLTPDKPFFIYYAEESENR
jgi:hypothetical protein